MMNFRSSAGGSGGGSVLKGSGGRSNNNPCLEQHNSTIATTTTTITTAATTCTAQGFTQNITNNIYEGLLIDQDLFISSPSLASTAVAAAASINSGSYGARASTGSDLLYYLSVLREKVQQLQALVATTFSNHTHHYLNENEPPAATTTSAASLIQEIIFAASSMAYAFQQLSPVSPPGHPQGNSTEIDHQRQNHHTKAAPPYAINHDQHDTSQLATSDDNTRVHQHQLFTFGSNSEAAAAGGGQYCIFAAAASTVNETQCKYNTINTSNLATAKKMSDATATTTSGGAMAAMELAGNINETDKETDDNVIIELDAADLLAKYTHFCQVCGKGFRRDANLRMHMRAHGDEYKTNAALTNPLKRHKLMMMKNKKKNGTSTGTSSSPNDELMLEEDPHEEEFAAASTTAAGLLVAPPNRNQKYSCPQEGCRWNKKHAKFQPLKSMVCVKNHYKRSHCPKMYVCNRCNRKQFSVLSDLRTHEKHCGDNLRWRCSCGTTFSRKDKLMGHVALFVGHAPAIAPHHNNTPYN